MFPAFSGVTGMANVNKGTNINIFYRLKDAVKGNAPKN
jgi:hypothetical protein